MFHVAMETGLMRTLTRRADQPAFPLIVALIAVALVRLSTFRSASPLAMASGSGSLCRTISTCAASLK